MFFGKKLGDKKIHSQFYNICFGMDRSKCIKTLDLKELKSLTIIDQFWGSS